MIRPVFTITKSFADNKALGHFGRGKDEINFALVSGLVVCKSGCF